MDRESALLPAALSTDPLWRVDYALRLQQAGAIVGFERFAQCGRDADLLGLVAVDEQSRAQGCASDASDAFSRPDLVLRLLRIFHVYYLAESIAQTLELKGRCGEYRLGKRACAQANFSILLSENVRYVAMYYL